jgi:hypothetical protein
MKTYQRLSSKLKHARPLWDSRISSIRAVTMLVNERARACGKKKEYSGPKRDEVIRASSDGDVASAMEKILAEENCFAPRTRSLHSLAGA